MTTREEAIAAALGEHELWWDDSFPETRSGCSCGRDSQHDGHMEDAIETAVAEWEREHVVEPDYEAGARAAFNAHGEPMAAAFAGVVWETAPFSVRTRWRLRARAAIDAAFPHRQRTEEA